MEHVEAGPDSWGISFALGDDARAPLIRHDDPRERRADLIAAAAVALVGAVVMVSLAFVQMALAS